MTAFSDFLDKHCSPGLTEVQRVVATRMHEQGRVIGVARAIGDVDYFPLVSFGTMQPNVIDRAGHYQLASKDGLRIFDPCAQVDAITDYYSDRANGAHANRAR